MRGPLDDIRVLDLGQHISAPYCAKLLGDYGAEVIKVEPPGEGDSARRMGPFPGDLPHHEKSGLYLHLNLNKVGVTLNLESYDGAKILKELVREADILVENFPPAYLPSLGLGYRDLEAVNPKLVMTSITPFGATGPYRDYLAAELGVFATSGRMYIHGVPEREPIRYGPDISWFQAGATAVVATTAALFASQAQGEGQHVDVSAMETLAGGVDNRILFYEYSGIKNERGHWPGGYPQGAYPCEDGYVVFGVGYNEYFRRLCHAMGMPEMFEDPKFSTADARAENMDELEAIFFGWMLEHTRKEVFKACQETRVPCSPIFNPEELMEDPQLTARGYFTRVEHPQAGTLTYPGVPFKLKTSPPEGWGPAPMLGEHNQDVYCGRLGYSQEDLVVLRSAGVI